MHLAAYPLPAKPYYATRLTLSTSTFYLWKSVEEPAGLYQWERLQDTGEEALAPSECWGLTLKTFPRGKVLLMGDPFFWLAVALVVLVLFVGRRIPEALRNLGNGRGGGPPTHPLPVTSPIETSRHPDNSEEPEQI